jgi:hypothetical protein
MLARLSSLRKAMLFYAIAAFLCTAVALFAPVFGDRTAIVAMFTPLLSVLARSGSQAHTKAVHLQFEDPIGCIERLATNRIEGVARPGQRQRVSAVAE